jgi:predicted nucleic acid-binding Zn ribbon protein
MIPARELIVSSLGEILRNQPMSAAKVRFAWESSVGMAIARTTDVNLDSDGTLHVTTNSEHWSHEVARSHVVIKQRLADLLGRRACKRLSIQRRPSS